MTWKCARPVYFPLSPHPDVLGGKSGPVATCADISGGRTRSRPIIAGSRLVRDRVFIVSTRASPVRTLDPGMAQELVLRAFTRARGPLSLAAPLSPMVLVLRVLARQQDASVEQPSVQCSGLYSLTSSATPPPWLLIGPSMPSISAIRSARTALLRHKASSASSRRYALRVVQRRSASMSTARSRLSGSDTTTLTMSSVCPVLPVGIDEPATDPC